MPKYWPAGAVLLLCTLVLLGVGPAPCSVSDVEPAMRTGVASESRVTAVGDTIRASTPEHAPLIMSLPSRVAGSSVSHYTILEAPALAGVAKRSFTWIPAGSRPGVYEAELEAVHPNETSDTLLVYIELKPE